MIVNMSVNINLNVSSGLGKIWYMNIHMSMIFKMIQATVGKYM